MSSAWRGTGTTPLFSKFLSCMMPLRSRFERGQRYKILRNTGTSHRAPPFKKSAQHNLTFTFHRAAFGAARPELYRIAPPLRISPRVVGVEHVGSWPKFTHRVYLSTANEAIMPNSCAKRGFIYMIYSLLCITIHLKQLSKFMFNTIYIRMNYKYSKSNSTYCK